MVEKGSLNHNSREFYASNVDPSRSYLNIEFCREDIRDVYHELFDDAQERFNAKQTRNDRRIENYYGKICSSKQEKPFHEIVLQIGNKDDTGIHTELAETAKQCLTEYAKGFQARNPTLRVFWSHLHMDEATPHVHIDFVPYITGSKRSMDTRVSLKQALAQLGFKGGTLSATEWNQWAQSEKQVLAEIMQEHGIEWEQLGTHEEHLSVLDYKKQERAKEVRALDTTIAEKQTRIDEIEQTLQSVQQQVVDLDKIENVSVKKTLLSDKVTLPRSDFENLLSAAKQYVSEQREKELTQIIQEEKLKEPETRKYLANAFRDGEIKTVGTDIDKLMPPVSRFGGGGRTQKKQTVIDKLKEFFDKYFGVGGSSMSEENS